MMKSEVSSVMPPSTQEAKALTRQGVRCFHQADFAGSIAAFSGALYISKQVLNDNELAMCAAQDNSIIERSTTVKCALRDTLHDEAGSRRNCFTQGQGGADPMIFNQPLTVNETDPTSYHKLVYIQIFNLGLSFHLSAFGCGPDEGGKRNKNNTNEQVNKRLRKALGLYDCALEMTTNHADRKLQLSSLEHMALINNIAQVHYALRNIKSSQDCFRSLLAMPSSATERRGVSPGEQVILDGFVSNALSVFFSLRGNLLAAAA